MTTPPRKLESGDQLAEVRRLPSRPEKLTTLARNLRLQAELRTILEDLERGEIDCFVLKGVPLSLELFGSLSARPMVDNDVVVRPSQVRRAYKRLRGLGLVDLLGYDFERSLHYNFQHSLIREFASAEPPCVVELHWAAFSPAMFDVPESLLFSELRELTFERERYRVLARELSLCYLCAHAMQHELSKPSVFYDLARAWDTWREDLDPELLRRMASRTGTFDALVYTLQACHEAGLCAHPIFEGFSSRKAAIAKRLLPPGDLLVQPKNSTPRALLVLGLLPTEAALDFIGGELCPHPQKMEEAYGELNPEQLLRAYLTRPFKAFKRVGRPSE